MYSILISHQKYLNFYNLINNMKNYFLKTRLILLMGLLFFCSSALLASPDEIDQQKTVTGVVTDDKGEPLPGVSVVIKGTTIGSLTDLDGIYSISADEDAVLDFTYIGFKPQSISVGNKTKIDVVLLENTQLLEEVVVVGYGTQKKVNLTGAVAAIDGDVISSKSSPNALAALQGEMPGVTVLRSSGQPGSETSGVRIRGFSSINDASALILIDGVEGSLETINPNDIESVSVLKDAAASAIYGARAAAGVILVTTKSGGESKEGKAKISYNGYFAINTPTRMPERLPAWEEQDFINKSRIAEAGSPEWNDERTSWLSNPNFNYRPNNNGGRWEYFDPTNWVEEGTRDYTTQQNHSVSISGGSKKMNYLVSGSYFNKNGFLKYGPDKNERYNLRARLNSELNDYMDFGLIASYDGRFDETIPYKNSSTRADGAKNVLGELYQIRGRQPVFNPEEDAYPGSYNGDLHVNPIDIMKNGGIDEIRSESFMGKGELTIKNIVKGLKFKLSASRRASFYNRKVERRRLVWYNRLGDTERNSINQNGELEKTRYYRTHDTFEALAYYDLSFGKNTFNFLGGASYENYRNDQTKSVAKDMNSEELYTLNGYNSIIAANSELSDAIKTWSMMSYFGRINYNHDNRYLFEANIRYDGSSTLHPDKRWAVFPSLSAACRVNEEKWFNVPYIDNLKARVSWGQLGIGDDSVGAYDFLSMLKSGFYMGDRYTYQERLRSKDKTWEVIETTNIGFDLGLFSNRLTFVGDYYWKYNNDMLIDYQLPSTVGAKVPRGNLGKLKTWGWEFEIGWKDKIQEVSYQVSFNLSDSQNKLVEFNGINEIKAGAVKHIEGYPINTIWGFQTNGYWSSRQEYLDYKAANPGYESFNDAKISGGDVRYVAQGKADHAIKGSGTPDNPADLVYLGNSNGRYMYGLNLAAQWKGFDFSMLWQGVAKRDIIVKTETIAPLFRSYNMPWTMHRDYWTEDNQDAYWPRLYNYNGNDFNFKASDKWVQDASYIRLKNVQLGYTIPINQKIVSRCRVYVSGDDVWEYTKLLDAFDPEVKNEASASYYPFFRTWTVGLNLTF